MCDSDVGIHRKRGICMDLCYTWYDLCMSDSFVIRGAVKNNSLDFPTFDDPPHLVAPLYEIVSEVEEFCERMGFPVYEEPYCYNGVPVASSRHLNKKTQWQDMFTWPSNKSRLDWSIQQILTFMFRNPAIYQPLLKTIAVIFAIMLIGYLFNRWQMSLRDDEYKREQAEIKKRMKDMVDRQAKRDKLLKKLGITPKNKKKYQ